MHNSPPSVHSTCVIKAVLYPLFAPLVCLPCCLTDFFLFLSFTPSLSCSLCVSDSLTHTHSCFCHILPLSFPCMPLSERALSWTLALPRTEYLFFFTILSTMQCYQWLNFTTHASSISTLPGGQLAFFTTHRGYCPGLCTVCVRRCVFVWSQSHQGYCGGWQCHGTVNQFLL